MAQNFNDYDELLKMFEDEPKKKTAQATSKNEAPSKRPSSATESESLEKARKEHKKKVQSFNLNIDREEASHTPRGEVYFSNSPEDIKESIRKRSAAKAEVNTSSDNEKPSQKAVNSAPQKRKVAPPPTTETQQKILKLKAMKKEQKKNKKRKASGKLSGFSGTGKASVDRKTKLTHFALTVAVIAFCSVILCAYGVGCINDILALNRSDTAVEVTVSDGMSDSEVINILKKKDLIQNKLFCKLFVKLIHITDSPRYEGGDYVTGVYTLSADMGLEKMLSTVQSDFTLSETIQLTFPEGWTADQIAEKLETNEVCSASSFITTLQSVDFSEEYPFLKNLTDKEDRFRALEGYLYPDTYEFYLGENASSVVRRFLDNFKAKWIDTYTEAAEQRGMSIDQIMTIASILQKEAADTSQMSTISSILYNRLDSSNFQWLQCDSTETYLLETIKPTLTSSTEDTEKYIRYRDLYDTYSTECKGLPLGPICNPGDSAIYAALHPEDTTYFYFRHDDSGKIYYASTFAEHEQNGRKIENS